MIPGQFVMLDQLPLTSNGKLDRSALYELDLLSTQFEVSYTAPADQLQEMLVEIWAAVLGVERVGINDNFFELGGHSLLAAQVMSRVQKAFKTELPLRLLFEFPSVAAFAEQMVAIRKDDLATLPPFELVSREEDLRLSFARRGANHRLAGPGGAREEFGRDSAPARNTTHDVSCERSRTGSGRRRSGTTKPACNRSSRVATPRA
jgi:acyl carrier protein